MEFDDLPETFAAVNDDTEKTEIAEILRHLPEKYREVLYLFYYEDLKTADIALLLKRNESTVRTQLQKGRELMRKMLCETEDNDDEE